jgi:hypothetical protein
MKITKTKVKTKSPTKAKTKTRPRPHAHGALAENERLFWSLAAQLMRDDERVLEGTIMNGRCLRVGKEFLALVDYKGSGLVVKLPRPRVAELVSQGVGRPFAPAGRVFREWLAVPRPDRRRWLALLLEGIAFARS